MGRISGPIQRTLAGRGLAGNVELQLGQISPGNALPGPAASAGPELSFRLINLVDGNVSNERPPSRSLACDCHFPLMLSDGHVLRHSIERDRLKKPFVPEAVKA